MGALLGGVLHTAEECLRPSKHGLLAAAVRQKLHRGHGLVQGLGVVLGHIRRLKVRALKERFCNFPQEGGLARAVFPGYADMLRAPEGELDILREEPAVLCAKLRQFELQHRLPGGYIYPGVKARQDGLLAVGELCKVPTLPVIAALHGLYGLHLLFQQPRYRIPLGMADTIHTVLHLLLHPLYLLLAPAVLLPLLSGQLLLLMKAAQALLHILPISHPGHGPAGQGLAPQELHMQYHVSGVLQKGLVVGDVHHRPSAAQDEPLQPLEGLHVKVVAGLVKKVHVRPFKGQERHPELHLLPAGQGPHGPVGIEQLHWYPQLPRGGGELAGRALQKRRLPAAELIPGERALLGAHLLGQVPQEQAVLHYLPAPFGVALHHRSVINKLQKGGLAVPLLAYNGHPVPGVQGKAESREQRPQVIPHAYTKVLYL